MSHLLDWTLAPAQTQVPLLNQRQKSQHANQKKGTFESLSLISESGVMHGQADILCFQKTIFNFPENVLSSFYI